MAYRYDCLVGAPQVLLRPVTDRSHTLLARLVLIIDTVDPGERLGPLNLSINLPIVVFVAHLSKVPADIGRTSPPFTLDSLQLSPIMAGKGNPPDIIHAVFVVHWNNHMPLNQ